MDRNVTTDKAIRALGTAKAQEDVRVGGVPGLRLRVSKTGRKTFMYVYRALTPAELPAQKRPQRRITIGRYPEVSLADARSAAKRYQGDLARGTDPQGSRRAAASPPLEARAPLSDARLEPILGGVVPAEGTFAHLATEYLIRHAWTKKKRTRDDESMLRRDLIPRWGQHPAGEIRKRQVIEVLDAITDRGAPVAARATKLLVSKIYNFGISRDMVEHNPTLGVAAPQSKSRDVWLRDPEIRTLWSELDRRRLITASIFRAILLTLQRPGEVCRMEWQELEGNWWQIPGEKTKNGLAHRVYLAPEMQRLLAVLRPVTGGSRYVFQSPKTTEVQPTTYINKVGYSICRTTGLSFTPHDLRRTGATNLGELGFPDEVIDAILNHKGRGVVKIYNRYAYAAEKQAALTAWNEKLGRLLGFGTPDEDARKAG